HESGELEQMPIRRVESAGSIQLICDLDPCRLHLRESTAPRSAWPVAIRHRRRLVVPVGPVCPPTQVLGPGLRLRSTCHVFRLEDGPADDESSVPWFEAGPPQTREM